MLLDTNFQFRLLLCSLAAGIITGILFDIYRIIRGSEHINKVFIYIEDALFWLLASIVVFIFLLRTNYAYISAYVYAFIGLGIYLYMKLLSRTFIKIESAIGRIFAKTFRILFNRTVYPFKLASYNLKKRRKIKK